VDKITQARISPCKGFLTSSPVFAEANLIFECRKIYSDVYRPQQFIDQGIENNYKDSDYHTYYYGEILTIFGDRKLYT
jgi:flavin reductase (DIM6/NTAB) family NADH-FMN oxidoreductase RutF